MLEQNTQDETKVPVSEPKDKDTTENKMDKLIASIDKLTHIQTKLEKQNRLVPTIFRATAYALGSTLGLAIVLSLILYLLKSLGVFDNLSGTLNNLKDLKNIYTN